MKTNRRLFASATAVALALLLGACGGDDCSDHPTTPDCNPPPSPSPSPEVRTLILEGSFSGLEELMLARVPFDTNSTGRIEATVDWTFGTDDVDIYLVRGSCTIEQFNNRTCTFAAFSESASAKPERISAGSQAAGSYNLYIGNRGPAEEAVSFQIFLVTGGSASSASTTRVDREGRAEDFVGIVSRH